MGPVNLAYPVEQGCTSCGRAVGWGVVELLKHPVIGISVVAVLVIGVVYLWMYRRAARRAERAARRAELVGTARVLSFAKSADYRGRCMCRIELEVNIPGREPYVAHTEQNLGPHEIAAIQQGTTVPVRADPDNPKSVRIDFSQPIT
jgi:hypothetical protein